MRVHLFNDKDYEELTRFPRNLRHWQQIWIWIQLSGQCLIVMTMWKKYAEQLCFYSTK